MIQQANLSMALPPGWVALDKEALVAALDEGFLRLAENDGALMQRLRGAETHLIAFSPSPVTGKPQAVLTATAVDDPANAAGLDDEHSSEWSMRQWDGREAIGRAHHVSRASRIFDLDTEGEHGLVSVYEIGFETGAPGAVLTVLMKLPTGAAKAAIELHDEIASTLSVEQRS